MLRARYLICCAALALLCTTTRATAEDLTVSSLRELAEAAAGSGNHITMKPGTYSMAEYLTDERIAEVRQGIDPDAGGRPPVWMLRLVGSDNTFELAGVTIEIETQLYAKLPRGYVRCILITGNNNTLNGLTIRNTGPNQGSNGNILSVFGDGNTLEGVKLYVHGSSPYGYGDLLGKGGPNLGGLFKQSGIMVGGDDTTLRRCRVVSRAFGHCFYIQGADDTLVEDCYAEGVMRTTSDMLRDTEGRVFDLGFKSVGENRDGRFMITPGYTKSLVEDGFRTYGNTGRATFINCIARNTRAGFEVGAPDDAAEKTLLENCQAIGCERGFLIGSNTLVRNSRGDITSGPLLYLRGGVGSEVEIELFGPGSETTVHALATIAGKDHAVRLTRWDPGRQSPNVPIMLGFGMPPGAEMASPIRPAVAERITLMNETGVPVIVSDEATDCTVESDGPVLEDEATKRLR